MSYGQFCPIAKTMELLGERWTVLIIRELLMDSHHFNELRRGVPRMSPSLLSKRLREMERAGLVSRREDLNRVRYDLTPGGRELAPIVMALGEWGVRWRSQLGDEDLDPHLLMWDVHRNIDVDAMPSGRSVIAFDLTDVRAATRHWYIVVDGTVDLCDYDPGFDVLVTVRSTLRDLTHVWRGDIPWSRAVREELLRIEGPVFARRALPKWLALSPFAPITGPRQQLAPAYEQRPETTLS